MATPAQKKLIQKRLADIREANNAWYKRFKWTGFSGKTFWDWMQLLIVPLALASLTLWFNFNQSQISDHNNQVNAQLAADQQREMAAIAVDQQREMTLQTYFDRMSDLLLKENLAVSKPGSEVQALAEARTLTTLRNLDGGRKGTLIRYLWEAELINALHSIISLSGADISGANLSRAYLSGANLSGAHLENADLGGADLENANLSGASLSGAHLENATLVGANLSGSNLNFATLSSAHLENADLFGALLNKAVLTGATLSGANLSGALLNKIDLSIANLSGADLKGDDLSDADLRDANLHGAKYNSKEIFTGNAQHPVILYPTLWPPGFDPKGAGAICVDC